MASTLSLVGDGLSLQTGASGLSGSGLSVDPGGVELSQTGLSLGPGSVPPPPNPMLDLTNPNNVIYQLLVWGF